MDRLCASPALYLGALNHTAKAASGLRDYLLEPARFRKSVEPATAEELEGALPVLLATGQKTWSLAAPQPRAQAVVDALLEATNAVWRAAAVFVLSQREDEKSLAVFERAVKDSNAWVRAAAAIGLARTAKDRSALEARLGPLIADENKTVAFRAAVGLLEPETRSAASLEYEFNNFQFEGIHAWAGGYTPSDGQRPLAALEGKPAFLAPVRLRLAGADPEHLGAFALLLAQYGDFTGLDRLLETAKGEKGKHDEVGAIAMAGIALSRDAKYLPYLRRTLAQAKDEQEYRGILQALKGMTGPDARALRLEVNKRMRQGGA